MRVDEKHCIIHRKQGQCVARQSVPCQEILFHQCVPGRAWERLGSGQGQKSTAASCGRNEGFLLNM